MTFSFDYPRDGFPPLQRHWYLALCTWHILGDLRCHLLLCHVAAIGGFWVTPHGAPPFGGTSLFWRSIGCVVAKICCHRVNFIPNFCGLYSKMHNKTLKIAFSTALRPMATFNQKWMTTKNYIYAFLCLSSQSNQMVLNKQPAKGCRVMPACRCEKVEKPLV